MGGEVLADQSLRPLSLVSFKMGGGEATKEVAACSLTTA